MPWGRRSLLQAVALVPLVLMMGKAIANDVGGFRREWWLCRERRKYVGMCGLDSSLLAATSALVS
jgi:hypothetical protein